MSIKPRVLIKSYIKHVKTQQYKNKGVTSLFYTTLIPFSLEGGGGGQADLREGGGDQNGGGRDSSAQG